MKHQESRAQVWEEEQQQHQDRKSKPVLGLFANGESPYSSMFHHFPIQILISLGLISMEIDLKKPEAMQLPPASATTSVRTTSPSHVVGLRGRRMEEPTNPGHPQRGQQPNAEKPSGVIKHNNI